ncbi:MAG: hypothetical protein KDK41_12785 [Leptospiraceae bacterium]|nr:hypothetical protein [Leptospiraceae bacterium]
MTQTRLSRISQNVTHFIPVKLATYLVVGLLLMANCKQRELVPFAFCKETQNNICIPPVHLQDIRYTLHDLRSDGSMRDAFNDLYFRGDTLAFHFIPKEHKRTDCDYTGDYSFPELVSETVSEPQAKAGAEAVEPAESNAQENSSVEQARYPLQRLDCSERAVSGFTLVGSMYEIVYANRANEKYAPFTPLLVKYTLYKQGKLVVSRSIRIIPENLP